MSATVIDTSLAVETRLEESPIASAVASDKAELWRSVMGAYFGTYRKASKCWIGKGSEGEYCLRPHTLHRLWRPGGAEYFMTVGGTRVGETDCHACQGRMGFLILKDTGGKNLSLVAKSRDHVPIGAWGQVPFEESVFLQRFGKNFNYGWAIEGGFTGQGTSYGWTDLFGIVDGEVRNIGQIPQSFDDSGNCSENGTHLSTGEKCSSYEFEIHYGATEEPQDFSPVLLTGSGQRQGQPFVTRITIPWDTGTNTYTAPKQDLPPEFRN